MSGGADQERRRDPHDVLCVPRGADRQQVIRAFRRKARSGAHPDAGGDVRAFEEIVRARDELLDRSRPTAAKPARPAQQPATAPGAGPRPSHSPPRRTSTLAVVTAVLALFGPLFWPVAVATGLLALRRVKRTGERGATLVPIVLFLIYLSTLPVLLILSLILIP